MSRPSKPGFAKVQINEEVLDGVPYFNLKIVNPEIFSTSESLQQTKVEAWISEQERETTAGIYASVGLPFHRGPAEAHDHIQISTRTFRIDLDFPSRDFVKFARGVAPKLPDELPEDVLSTVGSFLSGKSTYRLREQESVHVDIMLTYADVSEFQFKLNLAEAYKIVNFFRSRNLIDMMNDENVASTDPRFAILEGGRRKSRRKSRRSTRRRR